MAFLPILGKVLGAVTGLSGILGKQQEGAAKGRAAEAQLQQNQDRNAIDLYSRQQSAQDTAAQTDLERKAYGAKHQSTAFREALMAQLLGNYSPTSVSVAGIKPATVSGGMSAAMQNPGVLALLKKIAETQEGNATTPLQFSGGEMVNAPSLTPLPKQSGGSKLLDTIARIGQIAGGIGTMIPNNKRPPIPMPEEGGYG